MLNNFFFRKTSRLWENVEKFCTEGHATDDNMEHGITCWIPKATNTYTRTHTGSVILIAFPQQQWLHERASILRFYKHCLSCLFLVSFHKRYGVTIFVTSARCGDWHNVNNVRITLLRITSTPIVRFKSSAIKRFLIEIIMEYVSTKHRDHFKI